MIRYNNTEIDEVQCNGSEIDAVTYNGISVFDGGKTTLSTKSWGARNPFYSEGTGAYTTNETAVAIALSTTENKKYIGEFNVTSSVTKDNSYYNNSGNINATGPFHVGSGTYMTIFHKPNGYGGGRNYGFMKMTMSLSNPKLDQDYTIETTSGWVDYGHESVPRLTRQYSRYSTIMFVPYSTQASASFEIYGLAFDAPKIVNNDIYGFDKNHELTLITQYTVSDNAIWPYGSTAFSNSNLELGQKMSTLNITTTANNGESPRIGCVDIDDSYHAVIRVFLLQGGKYIKFGTSDTTDIGTIAIIDLSTVGNTYYLNPMPNSLYFEVGIENYIRVYDKYGSTISPFGGTDSSGMKRWYSSNGINKIKVISTP